MSDSVATGAIQASGNGFSELLIPIFTNFVNSFGVTLSILLPPV